MLYSLKVHSFHLPSVTRFFIALNVAIPGTSLIINRRLYKIATMKTVTVTASEKRRDNMIDLFIGIGLPILQVILGKSSRSVFTANCSHGMQHRDYCFVSQLHHI